MHLTNPTKKYEQSWQEAMSEFRAENRIGFWNCDQEPTILDDYIQRTQDHEAGKNLLSINVPSTTYWLIDKGQFVGHANLRHKLNKDLETHGGHIGYYIRPSARRQGYGTKILELVLEKAKQLGLQKVLVMCEKSNIGSQKVIEKNGGQFQDKITNDKETLMRFWIDISPQADILSP